jgi:hypothetical protein
VFCRVGVARSDVPRLHRFEVLEGAEFVGHFDGFRVLGFWWVVCVCGFEGVLSGFVVGCGWCWKVRFDLRGGKDGD